MDLESSALILDEDVATQFGIEQSLQEFSKQAGLLGPSGTGQRYAHAQHTYSTGLLDSTHQAGIEDGVCGILKHC